MVTVRSLPAVRLDRAAALAHQLGDTLAQQAANRVRVADKESGGGQATLSASVWRCRLSTVQSPAYTPAYIRLLGTGERKVSSAARFDGLKVRK